jgi:DNA polymerase I-like protein with 3'-5' exonuclease and polymerase domains
MTCVGLSRKLSSDVGYYVSEEEAQKYIDNFNEIFSVFYEWKKNQVDLYQMRKYVKLLDGFFMFGNNPNERSLTNMPIQGMGAVILRKAIQLAQDNNITVVAPLHDALYIMFHKSDVTSMDRLAKAMVDAFCFYFPERVKESAKYTVSDMPLSVEKVHIDPRGKREYEQFKQYFDTDVCGDLL